MPFIASSAVAEPLSPLPDAPRRSAPAPVFGLADCNNFYASCETVFRPHLAGKPVIVLSNNDGCVIARSREAKALGVPMGAAAHTLKALIKAQGVVVCSANFPLYGDLSQRVMDVLGRFTPALDVYSIDEAFLDLTPVPPQERASYAGRIRAAVHQWTGIWVSVGVAPTKTLAKAANDTAKHQPTGALTLHTEAEIDVLLRTLAVEDVWGIGARRGATLRAHGITTAYALKQASHAWVKRHLYTPVARTQLELWGVACLPLEAARATKQQIMSSRSFGQPVQELGDLKEALAQYATRACEKLRAQRSLARVITVWLSTNQFREDEPHYSRSCTLTLPRATAYTPEIVRSAFAGLERLYRPGLRYHKTGIALADLVADTVIQPTLFTPPPDARQTEVARVMDAINARFGRDTIHLAATGVTQRAQRWRMRQAHRSPRYTTQWSELGQVQ